MPSNVFNSAGAQARSQFRRQWLRGVWGNPLARPADRWQAGLRIVLITLWALALPLAATVSSVLVADGLQAIDQSTDNHTQTSAMLMADPAVTTFADGAAASVADPVQASWVVPDGTRRSGPISVLPGLPAGSWVKIWIDPSGAPVTAPERPAGAVWNGVAVGAGIWLGWGIVLAVVFWLSVRGLNRGRQAEWDREWLDLSPR